MNWFWRRWYKYRNGISYFDKNRNGTITASREGLKFESHTQKGRSWKDWRSKKCEVQASYYGRIPSGKRVMEFDFIIDKWIKKELEFKGDHCVILQLWNSKAAPRAYLTVQREVLPNGKLDPHNFLVHMQNKNHDGNVTTYHTFKTTLGRVNKVRHEVNGSPKDGCIYSVTFNKETFTTDRIEVLTGAPTNIQFGLYWSGGVYRTLRHNNNMNKAIGKGMVVRFNNIRFSR